MDEMHIYRCESCGGIFESATDERFCPDCRPAYALPTFVCERCGGVFPKKCRGVQKYCSPCSHEQERERLRAKASRAREAVKTERAKRNVTLCTDLRELAREFGVRTSDKPRGGQSIIKTNREAQAAGLSYGEYMAKRRG